MLKYGQIEVDETHKPIKYQINDNGCYEVISHADRSNGYCCIKMNGEVLNIHRWYYQKMNPNIDLTDLVVRHKCDNRKCINLEHLEHGTQKDNVMDMMIRETHSYKLKKDDVLYIKELLENGITIYEVSKLFNMSYLNINLLFNGKTWVYNKY